MATVAETPQEHRPAARPAVAPSAADAEPRRPWWRMQPLAMGIAAVALALAIGLGAWGLNLNAQLAEREDALRAVAIADAAFAVAGQRRLGAGSSSRATRPTSSRTASPSRRPDRSTSSGCSTPRATRRRSARSRDPDDLVVVPLEQDLDNATTFAVTVEPQRVEAPTSDPVLVASLEG